MARETADLVVVGAGTIGGWASVFAAMDGVADVVVIERDVAGQGASSRAAGVVRAQGGTHDTVTLGRFSIDFYRRQRELFDTDSGFRELGYIILAMNAADEREAHERIRMQRAAGLDVRWVDREGIRRLNPTMAPDGYRGGSYAPGDGAVDPPANVRAYSLAMQRLGVTLREHTAFVGLRTARARGGRRVTGVETSVGTIATDRVVLTGGPLMQRVAAAAGGRVFVGGARHQVAVTDRHEAFDGAPLPMMFHLRAGLYWRQEEGGLLWGMSNPDEVPGPTRAIDRAYLSKMRRRLNRLVPATVGLGTKRAWAATIEYTPDHLPILGPLVTREGVEVEGTTLASACGHGMMWGPAVSRIAADLALTGATDLVDAEAYRMDRFDEQGRSSTHDPIALPFPVRVDD